MADEISQLNLGGNFYNFRDTSKAPLDSPQMTGVPTAPTAPAGTNSTQLATTAFVQAAFKSNDSMIFKGTIGSSGATVTALPSPHQVGWTYKVITAGNYAGQKCEIGDMIICITDGSTASNDHWTVVQSNTDGTVTGPASATANNVVLFDGASGKLIKDSGKTLGKSVPSDAVFTDTKYTANTTSIGSASAGTAISADDITGWDAGAVPTLGDPIAASKISSWNAGSTPTLGTAISADDITAWNAGTAASFSVANGVLTIVPGTAPSLTYAAKSIPNVTSVGTKPSLTKEDVTIPNVTDVGSVPTLSYSAKTIPNITVTNKTVATGISVSN